MKSPRKVSKRSSRKPSKIDFSNHLSGKIRRMSGITPKNVKNKEEDEKMKPTTLQIKISGTYEKDDENKFKEIIENIVDNGGYDEYDDFNLKTMKGTFFKSHIWLIINHICTKCETEMYRWSLLDCKIGKDSIEATFGSHPYA